MCPKCGRGHCQFGESWNFKTGEVLLHNKCLECGYEWCWKTPILDEHDNETREYLVLKTVEEWVKYINKLEYTVEKVKQLISDSIKNELVK